MKTEDIKVVRKASAEFGWLGYDNEHIGRVDREGDNLSLRFYGGTTVSLSLESFQDLVEFVAKTEGINL